MIARCRWIVLVAAALSLGASSCSDGTAQSRTVAGAPDATPNVEAAAGGTCHYPANVDVNAHPSGSGCFAGPPKQICQVSNGATVNLEDGAVSGGTESCGSLCGASQYEMTCMNTSTDPDPSLGCQVIPIPTPSCCLFYCCPCAK